MSIEVIESGNGFPPPDDIGKSAVYIGIPQENSSTRESGITNAELMFIHTNGSPIMRIPARPTLEPALEENKERIGTMLGEALIAAVSGESGTAEKVLEDVGTLAENATIMKFGGGDLAPNAPVTVEGGWIRNRVTGAPVFVKGKHSTAPLIDTGSLRSSITHVVEANES